MKVIKSDKVPPLFHLLLMNNPYADAIVRDVQELVELQSVDPVHAAGGCYCRECKRYGPGPFGYGCNVMIDGKAAVIPHDPDHFCGDSEPREDQDDG